MSSVSLQDCFELFTQEETLEGDERPVSDSDVLFIFFCFSLLQLCYHIPQCISSTHFYL